MAPSDRGYKAKTRFAKFTNLPELLTMYHSFADVQTADMVKLDTPSVDKKVIALKPTETVLRLADEIAERAERIHGGNVDVHVDNMLKVTSDGKKVALDPRVYDRACEDEQESKINACIERVFEIWERTTDNKGVQLIFCDLSTPKKPFKDYEHGTDFDVYNDIKYKLVARGIPAEEIAFIHDANTDGQKMALYKDANAGKVRVFIGSTEKCGAGMNVQQRLFALHHLDTPYRPLDLQQREGRIVRQGNSYKNVEIYTYVTERTFDSYSYQILENKQRFISQIEKGDMTMREAEDIDEATLTYAEIKAITAANPRIKRKMEVDTEIQRLRVLESEYRKSLYNTQDRVRKFFPEEIRRQNLYLDNLRKDIETVKAKYNPDPEQFSINVLGKVYTDKTEGGRALMEALNAHRPETVVAEFAGMKISLNPISMLLEGRSVSLTGAGQYKMEIGESEIGLLRRLDNFMKEFPEREANVEKKLAELENNLKIAKEQLDVPFEHADELETLLKEQAELNAELDLNKRDEVVIEESDDSEETDEAYMGLLDKDETPTQRKKAKKPFGKSQKAIYEKVKAKQPSAYVFVHNGDNYEIMGDYTKELGGTLETGEYTVTSLNAQELDKAIRSLVDSGNTVKIIDEYEEIKEEVGILDERDKVAEMEIELMPDTSIEQTEMEEYGYKWKGMLPLRRRAADRLRELGLTIYKLYPDDTEGDYDGTITPEEPKRIYGIEKPDWKTFIESKEGKAYLYARLAMCKSASHVVNDELSYVDEKFTINFIENNFKERMRLEGYFFEQEKPSAEEMRKFIPALVDEFADRIDVDELNYYGWAKYDVASALADNLEPDELLEEANKTYESWVLRDYMQEGLYNHHLLDLMRGKAIGELDDEDAADEVLTELKEHFENSQWAEGFEDEAYDEWYDEFAEYTLKPILMGKHHIDVDKLFEEETKDMNIDEFREFLGLDKKDEKIDYENAVKEIVNSEFKAFQEELLKKSPVEVFQKNYEIYVKTEFLDTILEWDMDEKYYVALYQDKDKGIIQQLYDDFLGTDDVSVETYNETASFIKDYCEYYHKDIIDGIQNQLKDENVVYLGERGNTAYYYFKDKLGLEYDEPRIKKEADEYIIAAPVCYLPQEYLEEHNITFLKIGRDIDESVLNPEMEIKTRREMDKAYNRKFPLEATRISADCKRGIEQYIRNHFNGMRLDMEYFEDLIEHYGLERMRYVLANTVQLNETDGRYSPQNKEWAKAVVINNEEKDRRLFNVESHPAIVDGVITAFRKIEKEKFVDIKEGQEMPQEKREWVTVKVSQNAVIKRYDKHGFMRMPKGYYGDCTYNVYNDRMKRGTQITDLQSDSRELCFELRFDKTENVVLKNQNGDETVLSFEKFKEIVDGTTNADYEFKNNEGDEAKWFTSSVPNDALLNMGEKASLFTFPNGTGLEKYSFYIPNTFVKEDTESDDGRIEISIPSDLRITAKDKDGNAIEITPYQVYALMNNTENEQYVRQKAKTEYEESKAIPQPQPEVKQDDEGGWKYVSVPESAKISEYGDSTLFCMPTSGDYKGYAYFIPNKLLKANEEKGTIRISLPDGFIVKAKNNRADKKEEKKVEFQAEDFVELVKDKGEGDYESYQKPSTEDVFKERETSLVESLPQEMKDRPNWVAIKTWYNEKRGKVEKRPIDCNTGEYADSVNPATWTTFDKARVFVKEKGYTTVAYALDRKDGICCIDLDGCLDDDGNYSALANQVMRKCGKTYMELSVSGKGLHIFGKTKGMDVRSFSKDGDMEFYQEGRFISMTGDGASYSALESFDTPSMKELILRKCEKRGEWKGQGQGVEGLSIMTDRDVVEKACADKKHGATFKALYEGQDLQNNHSNSDMSLMNRLAFWCNGDKEQMLRIFATSGLYRPKKSDGYYEGTAIKAVRDTTSRYSVKPKAPPTKKPTNGSDKGGK